MLNRVIAALTRTYNYWTAPSASPVKLFNTVDGCILAYGQTVPSDTTAGFATGCIFIHTDGAAGSSAYVNEGSNTSCDFDPLPNNGPVSTYTQTYSTADRTVAAPTGTTLAGTLTGTVDSTMEDVAAIALSTSDTYTDAAVNAAVNTAITATNLQLKELQTTVNALIADDLDNRKTITAIIDDLQAKFGEA